MGFDPPGSHLSGPKEVGQTSAFYVNAAEKLEIITRGFKGSRAVWRFLVPFRASKKQPAPKVTPGKGKIHQTKDVGKSIVAFIRLFSIFAET